MSSSLTAAQLLVQMVWSERQTITGFDSSTSTNKLIGSVVPTADASNASQAYFIQGTLAPGASIVFDLSSLVTTTYGTSIAPTGAYLITVKGTGATWSYDPYTSNQFYWFFAATPGSAINGNDGDVFSYGSSTPGAINGTHKQIRITNTAGVGTLTYSLAIILKTA